MPLPQPSARHRLVGLAIPAWMLAFAACGGDDAQAPAPDAGEPVTAGCRDGTIAATAAAYRVCYPRDWNGELVVYAHGYVSADEPLAIPDDRIAGQSLAALVNGQGYAYAATSYRANGLVADLAVDDVAQLAEEVRLRFRPDPVRTYVVGVSEGGLVAALAGERHAELFDGAVAACGPVGDFTAQVDYFGDFRVLFDYYFPGVIPGDPMNVPDSVRSRWGSIYVPAISTALQADVPATFQLLSVTGAPTDPADLLSARATVLDVLWYDVFALRDARERLGGQPYDNVGRLYHGSLDDAALNAGVVRIAADPGARAELKRFDTSGKLAVPLATLHTSGDPIVPVGQSERYAEKVASSGAAGLLVQSRTVTRYGHCAFQLGEVLDAFGAVIERARAAARID
jgi:pimeloyl-ACP methyl ester carboxylesterase